MAPKTELVRISSLIAVAGLLSCKSAWAESPMFSDKCIATPNRNVNYDKTLDQSISKLQSSNVGLNVGKVGLDFGKSDQETSENREALQIVQRALSDRPIALLETCLFYGTSCAAAASNVAIAHSAIDLVRSLCSAAIRGVAPNSSIFSKHIEVIPSAFRFIGLKPNIASSRVLRIKNTSRNPASFEVLNIEPSVVKFLGSCPSSDEQCKKPKSANRLDLKGEEIRIAQFALGMRSPADGFAMETVEFVPTKTPGGFVTDDAERFSVQYVTTAVDESQRTACTKWNDSSECLRCEIQRGPAYVKAWHEVARWNCPRMAKGRYRASVKIDDLITTAKPPGARTNFSVFVGTLDGKHEFPFFDRKDIDVAASGGRPCDLSFGVPIAGQLSETLSDSALVELRVRVNGVAQCDQWNEPPPDDGSIVFPEKLDFVFERISEE